MFLDSAFVDNKWCYNIIYYPRRKNELTFKGDFWVNDSTFAIKKSIFKLPGVLILTGLRIFILNRNLMVLNDSVFLLKRDYMMSDFSLSKKEKARGVYGKRTTVFNNYDFNKEQPQSFMRKS